MPMKPQINSKENVVQELAKALSFEKEQAKRFIERFHDEMRRGLAKEPSSLKMISSFVKRPSGREYGRYLALDLGGTNFRVMAVELSGSRFYKLISSKQFSIPKELTVGDGVHLFNFIASCIDTFLTENKLSREEKYGLGFTFSFPVKQTAVKSGELIVWTKGFAATGVVGRDVVALLEEALVRSNIGCISVDALANDTVGTLMAKSYQVPHCGSGVILGTGTNACYPEENELDGVIINTEWGNFDKFETSRFDALLDESSNNPKCQLFEKAVSGMYLGEIFRLIALEVLASSGLPQQLAKPYAISSENLSQIEHGTFDLKKFGLEKISAEDLSALKAIAKLVAMRSARLAVSAIVAILLWGDKDLKREHVVAIDGSLFEKYPGYHAEMTSFLKEIVGEGTSRIRFELAKDGSGVGAAIIAAVASETK